MITDKAELSGSGKPYCYFVVCELGLHPLWPERGYILSRRSIASCVGAIRGSRSSKSWRKSYTRIQRVKQRIRKAGRGVGEQTAVARCRGKTLRQLEEGKTAQKIYKVCLTPKCFSNTVRFGATGTEAAPIHVALRDIGPDGDRPHMILRFRIQDTGIKCGDTFASLTGQTSQGLSIIGSSPIKTVQCGK